MPSKLKYFGAGFALGAAALTLAVGVVFYMGSQSNDPLPTAMVMPSPPSASSTPPPTSLVPSATPTFTPTPTQIVFPSATASIPETPDAVQSTINAGGLIFTGPLSQDQQIDLYRASLGYAQTTVQDSKRVSKEVNGVGYGDPSNICGPLAIAILRDAGLMTPEIIPHDFWLLNPVIPADKDILDKAFPPIQYFYTKNTTPINKMDWRQFPLVPGDFLFIWHGSWGNFDHMLVVNRVDSNLRTYAVTNFGTPDGYVIAEAMLYDPADPSAGLFHTWTKERDAILGSTGFGGFELWRLRTP